MKQSEGKNFTEDHTAAAPILSKYKGPINKAEDAIREEELERAKKIAKEVIHSQGRKLPQRGEEDYERNLVLVATRGVVQLFNTVSEYQTNEQKEARDEIRTKNQKFSDMVKSTGEG